MNIQKQALQPVLQTIIDSQQQLQLIRQLLNEELTFNLNATFYHITQNKQQMDLFAIKRFICQNSQQNKQNQASDEVVQNVIKYYSNGQLYLNIDNWKSIMLSRQDQLLRKLASEREYTQKEPPNYILRYCVKILMKECSLHSQIISNYRKINIVSILKGSQFKLDRFLQSLLSSEGEQFRTLRQYLIKGADQTKPIQIKDLSYLFAPNNSKKINNFLHKKEAQQKQNKMNSQNVFVHRQFRKFNTTKNENKITLIRQAKSIEKHIDRNHTLSSTVVLKKIESYNCHLQGQLKIFFKGLDKIMKYNNTIIKRKQQLISSNLTNFSLFFNQISANKQIIPSQLQRYFESLHITIPLPSIFVLFKRYCDPITNKINKKQFNSIFRLQNHHFPQKTNKINDQFRRKTCLCLLYEIEVQAKIEQLKQKVMDRVDLRQIFDVIDEDNDRQFSQTDFKILYRKIMSKNVKQEYIYEWWWRMNSSQTQMIDYDSFMYEMIPKIKDKQTNK